MTQRESTLLLSLTAPIQSNPNHSVASDRALHRSRAATHSRTLAVCRAVHYEGRRSGRDRIKERNRVGAAIITIKRVAYEPCNTPIPLAEHSKQRRRTGHLKTIKTAACTNPASPGPGEMSAGGGKQTGESHLTVSKSNTPCTRTRTGSIRVGLWKTSS
jgi:hypothetical protein